MYRDQSTHRGPLADIQKNVTRDGRASVATWNLNGNKVCTSCPPKDLLNPIPVRKANVNLLPTLQLVVSDLGQSRERLRQHNGLFPSPEVLVSLLVGLRIDDAGLEERERLLQNGRKLVD